MSARELLAASGVGGKIVDTQTFTASGTWIKPADVLPTDLVIVDLWGGGGGGAKSTSNGYTGGAGGGGAHNRETYRAFDLPSSVPVVVGAGGLGTPAGGSGPGTPGGYSQFFTARAYGGGAGDTPSADYSGSGGGKHSAGLTYSLAGSSSASLQGGEPQHLVVSQYSSPNNFKIEVISSPQWITSPGEWGGASNYSGVPNLNVLFPGGPMAVHGGGCGAVPGILASLVVNTKNSMWGGAGGGVNFSGSTTAHYNGGTSQYGGNGGAAAVNSLSSGSNGSPRGGGGGGAYNTGAPSAGNGGRGEVVITVIRGI